MRITVKILTLILFLLAFNIKAQEISIAWVPEINKIEHIVYPKEAKDSLEAIKLIRKSIGTLRKEGFLLANADSIIFMGNKVRVVHFLGEKYKWVALDVSEVSESWLSSAGFPKNGFEDQKVRPEEFGRLMSRLSKVAGIDGYPFADFYLDSISITGGQLVAKLQNKTGPLITYDTLNLPNIPVKNRFIEKYLGIEKGEKFNYQVVSRIGQKVKLLPYLKLVSPPSLEFAQEKCLVTLPLKYQKISRFDAVIGFLPKAEGSGLQLIGQVNLDLQNLFQSGKHLYLYWQAFKPESQTLKLGYANPYLFGLPLNLDFSFDLLKQDTTFLTTDLDIGLSHDFNWGGNIGFFTSFRKSSRLEAPETIDLATYSLDMYGLRLSYFNLDDRQNPRKGWSGRGYGMVGNKIFTTDSLDLFASDKSLQGQSEVHASLYLRMGRSWGTFHQLSGGWIVGDELVVNDLFQLGGSANFRGFNENSIFASSYGLLANELRFYPEENTHIFVLAELGGVANTLVQTQQLTFSAGAGMQFFTTAGSFNLNIAWGAGAGQIWEWQSPRIHFGYLAYF